MSMPSLCWLFRAIVWDLFALVEGIINWSFVGLLHGCVFLQVKELGVVLSNCPSLADDASKLFEVYWYLGKPGTPLPPSWPDTLSTKFNKRSPMELKLNGTPAQVYFSVSWHSASFWSASVLLYSKILKVQTNQSWSQCKEPHEK